MNSSKSIWITEYTDRYEEQWNTYCDTHQASYASYPLWHRILPELGYKPIFLMAIDQAIEGNRIVGILPAALSVRFGRKYGISTWADGRVYAGPIADTEKIKIHLIMTLESMLLKHRVAWIKITPQPWVPGLAETNSILKKARYLEKAISPFRNRYTFLLDLREGFDLICKKLNGADRSQYRKSFRNGLEVRIGRDCFSFEAYYQLKCKVWRRLGNACPRRRELEVIFSLPPSCMQWWSAWYKGQFVGALYCYRTHDVYFLKGSIYDSNYAYLNINTRLYLESIESACREGKVYYDFGSTPPPGSGHYAWKKKFGGIPYPIVSYEKVVSPLQVVLRNTLRKLAAPLLCRYSYLLHGCDKLFEWFEE